MKNSKETYIYPYTFFLNSSSSSPSLKIGLSSKSGDTMNDVLSDSSNDHLPPKPSFDKEEPKEKDFVDKVDPSSRKDTSPSPFAIK